MQKIDIIDAELARLHSTYGMLIDRLCASDESTIEDILNEQLQVVQEKISRQYDLLAQCLDDYEDNYLMHDNEDVDDDDKAQVV